MSSSSSSSNSPCAACKCLRRKCTQECVFAPYFPPDNPQKFTNVHKVFGASNVAKLLNELSTSQREDAVNSLAYEAEYRLRDPVYGCVGLISILQHKLKQVQLDLDAAKKELAAYIHPPPFHLMMPPPPPPPPPYMMGVVSSAHQHFLGGYEHQHQNQFLGCAVTATGFNQPALGGGSYDDSVVTYSHIQPPEELLTTAQKPPAKSEEGRSLPC